MSAEAFASDPVVARQMRRVEALLSVVSNENGHAHLHAQLLSPRAKRLRPTLLLLAARYGTRRRDGLLERAAAGVELLHEASLYHDDIVDQAPLRRGEVAAHAAFGPAAAAFAGSELMYGSAGLFAELPPALLRSIGRCVEALCRGQLRELEVLGDLATTIRERLRVMRDKTARLFALAASLGARLSDADARAVQRLGRFGLRFGMCFQLADDLRDLTASAEVLGRPPGSDLLDGVYTLPVLHALVAGAAQAASLGRRLQALMQSRDREELRDCIDLVRRSGGMEIAAHTLSTWVAEAKAELEHLPPAPVRQSLCSLLTAVAPHSALRAEAPVIADPASPCTT